MTSPAMISPTTDGVNAVEPGMSLRWVHLCTAPGGQIQFVLQLMDISSSGLVGSSLEYTTFKDSMPLFLHSLRMTFAKGHTEVS